MPNGASVDQLYIEVNAKAQSANNAIDSLVGKLDRLSASLGKINGTNLTGLANGVQRLGNAMQIMNQIKTADFTRLASNLQKMGNIDVAKLNSVASSMSHLTRMFNNLGNISDNAQKLGELAKGIAQLGYKSSTIALDNIPKLAVAMKQLMVTLSTAPKVSQNIIDMTNALAKLARTGSSSGKAATSLSKSLNLFSNSTTTATKKSFSLASAIGKLYATYWMLFRAFRLLGESINISSDLTEVQNVVDVTFGKYASMVENMSKTSITDFGMSELTVKQVSSRFQAMGTAMGFAQGKMADMSIELTKLTADMASFYNVEQSDVAEDLASVFTGQTRPLRAYGLDLTEATLKEWAMKQGLDANIDSMSQAEKTMLRYQYVMANTGAAQGDFARTINTWANQTRILKENIKELGKIIGGTFINVLKPLVKALNVVIGKFNAFAEAVSNSLGKIFGWTFKSGGGATSELEDGVESAEGISSGLGDAANNAKKLKNQLSKLDELNVINTQSDSGSGSGSGSGSASGATGTGTDGQWVPTESILDGYESELDTLYKLGEYISEKLTKALNDIDWDNVYQGARNFGKGLADFLNGLISPEMFGAVGKTIAGSLNTALNAALSFGQTFDFYDFGVSLATGINEFFDTFEFEDLAETLNVWVDGLEDAIAGFLKTVKLDNILAKAGEFLGDLELDTVKVVIGAFTLRNSKDNITMLLKNAFLNSVGSIGITLKEIIVNGINKIWISSYIGKNFAAEIVGKLPGTTSNPITIPNIILNISNIVLGASGIGTASFDTIVGELVLKIDEALGKLIPDWAEGAWESIVMGIAGGAISGSWLPGFGTVAGAIIGGILGALNGIKFDGSSILKKIIDGIFNFNYSSELFNRTKQFFEEAGKAFEKNDWLSLGKNIVLGVLNGIWNALAFIAEPIVDLFNAIYDGICNIFGIHSPADAMEPLGKNILLGIVQGFLDSFEKMTDAISNFFTNIVKPWFTTEKWIQNIGSIKDALSNKWNSAVDWWNKKPSLSSIKISVPNILSMLSSAWDKAKKWWKNNVKLSIPKLNFRVSFKSPSGVIQKAVVSALNLQGWPSLQFFASGGFPEDGWFRANHGEIMGKFDNGQSVVANNMQITEGISAAVYKGNRENNALIRQQIGLLQRQNELLLGILEKETGISADDIFSSVRKSADDYFNRTGKPVFQY